MSVIKQLLCVILAAASAKGLYFGDDYTQADIDSGKVLAELSKTAYDNAMSRLPDSGEGCTKENVKVRKEWRTIPIEERVAYQKAVTCLMETDTLYPEVAGAKSAYDDFAVLHHNLTPYVHFSATFFLFHRYYIHTFEEAIRGKCGYTGIFPYWEWGLDCADMDASPVFDGSEASLGGNGAYVRGGTPGVFGIPPGTGGGCVRDGASAAGPFANFSVNLGPTTARDPLAYNPRCLRRDLNSAVCAGWSSLRNTTETILAGADIALFQAVAQGDSRWREALPSGMAIHGGGHYSIGGDPGGDFYFSPLEPGFWVHHGQMDRLYFVWQNLDWENRQNIAGTRTMMNQPPSDNATLDDILDLTPLNEPRPLKELLDTTGATPMCFVYAPLEL